MENNIKKVRMNIEIVFRLHVNVDHLKNYHKNILYILLNYKPRCCFKNQGFIEIQYNT